MTAPGWRASGSILDTGCRWRDLPPQLGFGSEHTA
jgi:transposase